eukprot:PLAT11887.1.p2 GENE.PLAT11887.1~~PLAT11887.1.p2  ORF type:complete len:298 (+),score=161.10 PLAT11887.1:20-913(+)
MTKSFCRLALLAVLLGCAACGGAVRVRSERAGLLAARDGPATVPDPSKDKSLAEPVGTARSEPAAAAGRLPAVTADGGGDVKPAVSVIPAAVGGLVIQPAPGQADGPIVVRADGGEEESERAAEYASTHMYQEDTGAMLSDMDATEAKARELRLRVAEKRSFVASLRKRETRINDDVKRDEAALKQFDAHVAALRARIERLRKERELRKLRRQFTKFALVTGQASSRATELQHVTKKMQARIASLTAETSQLKDKETMLMTESLGGADAAAAAGAALHASAVKEHEQGDDGKKKKDD